MFRSAFVLLALAGCWSQSAPRSSIANAPATATSIRLRAADGGAVDLLATTALDDGGLIVVAQTSATGVQLAGHVVCKQTDEVAIVRFDAAGAVRWSRCAGTARYRWIAAAVDETSVWIARIVDPNSAEHEHGHQRDLIVAEHYRSLDGMPIGSRVVSVFEDASQDRSITQNAASNVVENMQVTAATIANGELLLAGSSKTGSIVDGQWRVPDSNISLHGFVLGVPVQGPVRAVFETSGAVIQTVSAANGRYTASGWCSTATQSSVPPRVSCDRGGTTAFTVTGDLAGSAEPRTYTFGQDIADMRSAISDDGSVVIAATSWRSGVAIDTATRLDSKCAKFAFVAAFSRDGTRRFARTLGDCVQPVPSPYARDGISVAESDDQISDHTFEIHDVALLRGAPVVVVGVEQEGNYLDWPVRFDQLKLSVPFARSAALLVLDPASGAITSGRSLRFVGPSERSREPDASLSSIAGVHAVRVTAGKHPWLVVEHGGSLVVDGARYALRTAFEKSPSWQDRDERPACDARTIAKPPRVPEVVESIRDGGGEPEDFGCRRTVVAETAIEAIGL